MDDNISALNELIDALLQWAGQGALILDHMSRHPPEPSSETSFVDVLNGLMGSVLTPLVERHGAAALSAAATVIADASETVGSELYLVDPDWSEA